MCRTLRGAGLKAPPFATDQALTQSDLTII
jgi:hypothetical protein